MWNIGQDVRFGLRVLRNNPGFTAVAVFTLALGISANTTVFSWVDGVLWHPFPGSSDQGRLALLDMNEGAPTGGSQMSWRDRRDYQAGLTTVAGIALHREDVFAVGDATNVQPVWGELVSGDYFAVLGMRPALGRVFSKEEDGDKLGAYPVVVISARMWRGRFHGDPKIVGKSIRVNRRLLTVVGVAPPEFLGTMPGMVFEMWVPATMGPQLGMLYPSMLNRRGYRDMYGLVRLKPGVSIEQARAETLAASNNLAAAFPDTNRGVSASIEPLWRFRSAAPDLLLRPLRILMAVSLLVLLIVCANVASLLLARSIARQREFGIRLALGATRLRLVRQMMTETLMLAAAGAVAGWAMAAFMADAVIGLIPATTGLPSPTTARLGIHSLAFTIVCCISATLLAGALPALFTARSGVNETLKENGRSLTGAAGSHRARNVLVVVEVALAVVALVGAGLFGRSLNNAKTMYPGFDKNHVLVAQVYLAGSGFSDKDVPRFLHDLCLRMRSVPGVVSVSYADFTPLGSSGGPWDDLWVNGYAPATGESMTVSRSDVGPGYLALMRTPLLEGREFRDDDDPQHPYVTIVNQAFAQRYFDGADPVGRKIHLEGGWARVIGLARDSKYHSVVESGRPFVYTSFSQRYGLSDNPRLSIRTSGDPLRMVSALRSEAASLNPAAAAFAAAPLEDWVQVTMLPVKLAAGMLGAMGMLSLTLAGIGLYSVMAFAVSQRTQEIGIRMAMGAMPKDVLADVLRRGMILTAVGLAAGMAGAIAVTRVVSSMLVGVDPRDPLAFCGAAVFLAAVAMLACYLPALPATKVDPLVALRSE